jgi:SNF2 family DNA or RNA helicase
VSRIYGKALLKEDGCWHLRLEPHAAMVFKRMLGRVPKDSVGTLKVKNTDDVCRDIEWFMQRYPLTVKPLEALLKRANRHKLTAEKFDLVVSGQAQPQHFDLALPPREYQRIAAEAFLLQKRLLLADQMGVGKTVSAICGLTEPGTRPALIVTMTSLALQWRDEIRRFCPQLRTHIIRSTKPYDVRVKGADGELHFPDVIITTYSKLAKWAESLVGKVKTVVFDEIQELRHRGTKDKPVHKYNAAKLIRSKCVYAWGLSGTPIYNYGEEFFSILDLLSPGALGAHDEYIREWCVHDQKEGKAMIKAPKAFGAYLRDSGLMLRRTREDVGRELPNIQRTIIPVDTDENTLLAVDMDVMRFARQIVSDSTRPTDKRNAYAQLDWRLRQATGMAKAPAVCALIEMLVEQGERVVVFGWHKGVYNIYRQRLAKHSPAFYTGEESQNQRRAAKQAFLAGESRVLVMSLRVAAGLDGLQHVCRTVVFGELDWAWGAMDQCECRVFRDGQREQVQSFYPLSDSGSDPIVSEVLGLKRWQLEGAMDPKAMEVVQQFNTGDGIRRLAERYLAMRSGRAA